MSMKSIINSEFEIYSGISNFARHHLTFERKVFQKCPYSWIGSQNSTKRLCASIERARYNLISSITASKSWTLKINYVVDRRDLFFFSAKILLKFTAIYSSYNLDLKTAKPNWNYFQSTQILLHKAGDLVNQITVRF